MQQTNNSVSYKVGVLDSGVGGLSILTEIMQQAPDIELHYFADNAFAPYGNLDTEQIQQRVLAVCRFFIELKVDAIVIACNTATVEAIDFIRTSALIVENLIPIIGVEPAVKPAAITSSNGKVTVLATPVTCKSQRLNKLVEQHTHIQSGVINKIEFICLESATLAFDIDYLPNTLNKVESEILRIREIMRTENSDTLVLACTHYPLIKNLFAQHFDNHIEIIDPNNGVTLQLLHRLNYRALKHSDKDTPDLSLYSSGLEDYGVRLFDWIERLLNNQSIGKPNIILATNCLT